MKKSKFLCFIAKKLYKKLKNYKKISPFMINPSLILYKTLFPTRHLQTIKSHLVNSNKTFKLLATLHFQNLFKDFLDCQENLIELHDSEFGVLFFSQ